MKNAWLIYLFSGMLGTTGIISCGKNETSKPAGGDLPTNYIMVKDSTFTPSVLTVVSGSSITFVNNTGASHTVMSDDSATIKLVTIAPGSYYFYKKDTFGTFPYHCTLHPNARGAIIITP